MKLSINFAKTDNNVIFYGFRSKGYKLLLLREH